MALYRLYFLDREGHFARAENFEADDDGSAVAAVADRAGEKPTELWCAARRVIAPASLQPPL